MEEAVGKGMRRRTSAIFLFCLSVEFFQRNAVVILIEFYQFHGRFAAWTLQGIVTEGAGDQGAPFIHREQESMFLSADGATEGAVFLPVSGIESIVTDHLEVFFRDMPDQPLNKFESGNGFLNISFIFMAVIVKSNQIAIITVNAGGSDDRAAEKYEGIAERMRTILSEYECNDTYGRCRMYEALKLKYPEDDIPSERTVYRIMDEIGISHRPKRKPGGITKADKHARKSDDLLKRDFYSEKPLTKCVTDITEIPAKDGKLYVSAVFDCYDLGVLGLAMADNMRADLCVSTIANAHKAFPDIRGAIIHSDYAEEKTMPKFMISPLH